MLTDLELKALTHADIRTRLRDGGGLVGQVGQDRAGRLVVSFSYQFRFGKTITSIAVGQWPKTSLKAIRKQRDIYRLEVSEGRNPVAHKKAMALTNRAEVAQIKSDARKRLAAIDAASARMTVSTLFERWDSQVLCSHKDGGAEIRRMLNKDVLPELGKMAVEDVKKRHIAAMLDKVKTRGVGRMANLMLAQVRQMFRFALARDWIEADPTATLKKADFGGKDVERERVLSESEIRSLSQKMDGARFTPSTEAAIWLMLSTCCRVGELSQARWADLDLDDKRWRIPAANTKNQKEHIVSLSAFAIRQFKAIKAVQMSSVWVFPAANENHLGAKAITKQVRDRQRVKPLKGRTTASDALLLEGGTWTPHDLRRTGATLMGELGVNSDVIERCLNHVEPNKMKRIYQRQRTETAKAQAWDLLGDRLELLTLATSNVITIAA